MELLRGKFVFRGMPYRIGRVFVLADEKGHFTMNMLFGDGRCSECNGRAGQWGDNFYIYHHQSYLSVGDPNLFFISSFFFSSVLLLASQALLRGYSRVSLVVVRAKRQEGQDLAEISEKRQEGRRHAPVRFSAPPCLLRGIGRRGK